MRMTGDQGMADGKCDSCYKKGHLTLTSAFEMLCVVCMHDQYQAPLMEVLAEKEAYKMKQAAMKKMSEDFEKRFKKGKGNE